MELCCIGLNEVKIDEVIENLVKLSYIKLGSVTSNEVLIKVK
jgi:hypothetical protein